MAIQYKLTVEEICKKLRPVFGEKMDDIYLRYAMADTREEKEEIAQILHALYNKNLSKLLNNQVLLEPPAESVMDGDYPLGIVSYAKKQLHEFKLRERDFPRHICVSGMSGSGKTTFAFHIINNFIKQKKPFLIFDWKKSFRPLMNVDAELMCFTPGNDEVANNLKFNINRPPKSVDAKEWINVLCDLLTESFFVSYGVHKVLLNTLDEAFKEHGVYNKSNDYPTWNYIKWKLEGKMKNARGREATWLESALRIAHVLTFGAFGKVCNYKGKESLSIEKLLDKKVILELNSLGNIEKKFFCEYLLTYIFKLKKSNEDKVDSVFESAILVDEAHNIFLKDKTNFVSESITDVVYREMREYGVSLVCLDQHISKISDTVKGNSACHIAFQQQLPQDIWDIANLMQMPERKDFFSKLEVGSAIVKLSERHTEPFLIKVPNVSMRRKTYTDKEIKERMKFIFEGKTDLEADDDFGKSVRGEKNEVIKKFENQPVPEKDISEEINEEMAKDVKPSFEGIAEDVVEGGISSGSKAPEGIAQDVVERKKIAKEENWPKIDEIPARAPDHTLYNGELKYGDKLKEDYDEIAHPIKTSKKLKNKVKVNEAVKKPVINEVKTSQKSSLDNKIQTISEPSSENVLTGQKVKLVEQSKRVEIDASSESKALEEQPSLSPVQQVLYEYVEMKLSEGETLEFIEDVMESRISEGLYGLEDVAKVIDYALEKGFNELRVVGVGGIHKGTSQNKGLGSKVISDIVTTREKQNIYKEKNSDFIAQDINKFSAEQERLMAFLQANPNHELSCVNVYKTVGLSARKGTKIKDELVKKGLVIIKEERNEKGWKKIMQVHN